TTLPGTRERYRSEAQLRVNPQKLRVSEPHPGPTRRPAASDPSSARVEDQANGGEHVRCFRAVPLTPQPGGVQQDGVEAGGARAVHVDRVQVADIGRLARRDARLGEGKVEDPRVGLLHADLGGVEDEVEVRQQAERPEERVAGVEEDGADHGASRNAKSPAVTCVSTDTTRQITWYRPGERGTSVVRRSAGLDGSTAPSARSTRCPASFTTWTLLNAGSSRSVNQSFTSAGAVRTVEPTRGSARSRNACARAPAAAAKRAAGRRSSAR